MMHETTSLLASAVALVFTALLLVTLSVRLRLPAIFGYLVTGLALGPHSFAQMLDRTSIGLLADIGVVLLMFMVGLQFSTSRIWEMRRIIFGVGLIQVTLVTTAVALLCLAFTGLPPVAALLVGAAAAMSSTALTLKQLADQDELMMRHGRLAIGILLFQDIATIPFLLLIGVAGSALFSPIEEAMFRALAGVAIFALIIAAGRAILRPLTAWLAEQNVPDLLQLSALALALGAALGAHHFGLPAAIGAFLVGLAVGDSEHRHQVERQIQPFRDVLVGVFFVSVGMQLDLKLLSDQIASTVGLAAALVAIKTVLTFATLVVFRQPVDAAARASLVLAHGGEFSLLLLSLAPAAGIVPPTTVQQLLLAVGISMFVAPLLIRFSKSAARFVGTQECASKNVLKK